MRISNKLLVVLILAGFGLMGFQCSSTELTSAKLYIQQKNYDKAIESLKKEIEKNPKSDEGYYWLGVVYGEKENIDEMVKAFDMSLSISNKYQKEINDTRYSSWVANFNSGDAFFKRANRTDNEDSIKIYYEKSIAKFQNAIKLEPDSANNYLYMAIVYAYAGREDEAIEPLNKSIKMSKEIDAYALLGEIYYNKGARLTSAFQNSKEKADSIAAVEQYNKAINVLEDGRKNYPNDDKILLLVANSYIGAGRSNEAVDIFHAGVDKDPENKNYRYNYGVVLLGMEKYEEAAVQFNKAVEIDPEYQNALYNLGVTYVKWGTQMNKEAEDRGELTDKFKEKYRLALPHLEKVAQMKSDDAATWMLLARVYGQLGMNDKAQDALDKIDELNK